MTRLPASSSVPATRRAASTPPLRRGAQWGLAAIALVFGLSGLLPSLAYADRPLFPDQTPHEFKGIGITEHLDEIIPTGLEFVDETGATVKLSDLLSDRPVILTLNYYRCTMLCGITFQGLVRSLKEMEWSAGEEFDIITISINPDEGYELADAKKRAFLTEYTRESAKTGWHFLTGKQENIKKIADAVGFGYRRESNGEYAHTSSIMFLTPEGRLSRYMNDVAFDPRDMKLALVEAGKGTIGSPMDKLLLFTCFRFDPEAGSYGVSAMKLMRLAGVLTIVALVTGFFVLRHRSPVRTELVQSERDR